MRNGLAHRTSTFGCHFRLSPLALSGEKLLISSLSVSGTLPQCGCQWFLVPYTFCIVLLLSVLSIPALAVDATWLDNPSTNIWNSGANWSGGTAPVNPVDTATFAASTQTSPTVSADIVIDSITFVRGASAFSIQVPATLKLTLQGVGIVNNSGIGQAINNSGFLRTSEFSGTSSAANATITNTGVNSTALFSGTSSAASATSQQRSDSLAVFFGLDVLRPSTTAERTVWHNSSTHRPLAMRRSPTPE